jgi:hypothetical protein
MWRHLFQAAQKARVLAGLAAVILAAVVPANPARSESLPIAPTLVVSGGANPIRAWVDFCLKQPRECEVDSPSLPGSRLPARFGRPLCGSTPT